MRIESPEITRIDGRHVLSAGVGLDSKDVQLPETMWFAVDDTDSHYVRGLVDAFLVSLLPTAMKLGEDIRVEGKVSSCLAHGLINYQRILSTWWPESFGMIGIDYDNLVDRRRDQRPTGVACVLADGLNSLDVFAQWLPGNTANKAYQITHAMMVNELEQADEAPAKGHPEQVTKELAERGIELLVVSTNQQQFRATVLPDEDRLRAHSSALAACAHAMAGVFGKICLTGRGGYAYEDLLPSGSHPAMDHHLGSDQLQVVHLISGTT